MTGDHPLPLPSMIEVEEATRLIGSIMTPFPSERVALAQATGRVLRETIRAERDQPPFDRVTMDGIAIRHAAIARGVRTFHMVGTQAAGASAMSVSRDDDAVAVMTGAILPRSADTVIPVERLLREPDKAHLQAGYHATYGQFVHRQASDHAQGTVILEAGAQLGAAEMAALTVSGNADVAVSRTPRIAIIATGDELVEPGLALANYQVRSSNDRTLEAALRGAGFTRIVRSRLADDPAILRRCLRSLIALSDVVILAGGVSMGRFDHVPQVLVELGIQPVFHRVRQRPGLPLWFGFGGRGLPVFALPGNPVSSLICLARYVQPALQEALGRVRPLMHVSLGEAAQAHPELTLFIPARLHTAAQGELVAVLKPTNTSGDFLALVGTDGFVELSPGKPSFRKGALVPFFRW